MNYNLLWIFLLIIQTLTTSLPIPNEYDLGVIAITQEPMNNSPKTTRYGDLSDEKVISVRITSSVAIGRGRDKPTYRHDDLVDHDLKTPPHNISPSEAQSTTITSRNEEGTGVTDIPPNLVGANIEYIKQLNAKKEREHSADTAHSFQLMVKGVKENNEDFFLRESSTKIDEYERDIQDVPLARKVPSTADANRFQDQKEIRTYQNPDINSPSEAYVQNHNIMNITRDALFESLKKFELETNTDGDKNVGNLTTIPTFNLQSDKKETRDLERLTRIDTFIPSSNNYQTDDSVAESSIKSVEFAKYNEGIEHIPPTATLRSPNNIRGLTNRPLNERRNNPRLTTVSFNIVHDTPKVTNDNEHGTSYISSSQIVSNQKQFYETPNIYSQPAQIYSEPAKIYSEPAKIYSEPAKIYSQPAKIYSEPAKIYSEPSKFYSEPASLHLNQNLHSSIAPNYSPYQQRLQRPIESTTLNTTPISMVSNTFQQDDAIEQQPEKNYEVDEKTSLLSDGRSHGVQQESTEKCKQDNCKVGYVVEGRQFKKYRVEERTPDGFIVGEYGVVRNEDGALRGVRYTADGDAASPRLIHDALMKFLQLK